MARLKWVGIVGPTKVSLMEAKVRLSEGALVSAARELGAFLAEHGFGMVCVPVKGVPLGALEAYSQAGGRHSLALWPKLTGLVEQRAETNRGNPHLADRIRDDLTWKEAPFELAKSSDCLVSIGLSCGTMLEMIATKWLGARPIFAIRSLMTGVPDEIAVELDLRLSDSVVSLKSMVLDLLA
jgi:hypothetical protein